MRCEEFQNLVEALGRGDLMAEDARREALSHAGACPACKKDLDESRALTAALRSLARSSEAAASPELEARLLAAFRSRERARPLFWRRHRAWMSAVASVLVLGLALARVAPRPMTEDARPAIAAGAREGSDEIEEIASDFFPLQGDLDLPDYEGRGLVRVLVPRTTLLAFGLPMNHERAFEPLQAEVLIGEDGAAKAIRFLNERP
jgi:hypothetical protein